MLLDTSALLAILFDEPERRASTEAIEATEERLLAAANVEIVAVDLPQANAAREAFRPFGKGRHPAGLNFGDCFSYALAQCRAEPLLPKSGDFARTDVLLA